ncbi:PaaI family thioesterase [Frigidibacter sp. MR17.14]|uniref:PaaI family thioesterase n=1 Tax=Frigidibacter sp. MR17.14 TaxID=3126509 RepID=UPI003012CF85
MQEPQDWAIRATRIRESFARQAMMRTLGAELAELAPGRAVIRLPLAEHLGQQHGFAHAAASFAIGDSAAGYAALGLMEPGQEVLTVEMKINLMAPAIGSLLVAEGRVIRPGRRITVVAAEVFAEDGSGSRRQVALLQGTMIPVTDERVRD